MCSINKSESYSVVGTFTFANNQAALDVNCKISFFTLWDGSGAQLDICHTNKNKLNNGLNAGCSGD